MKFFKIFLVSALLLLVSAPSVFAGDFAWTRDFNIQAQADPSGFKARLGTRFKIGDVEVKAVLSNFEDPADAYIALRFSEMCDRPVNYVVDRYISNKGKGWGRLAKSLGIKPGSSEFHALKRGHDMNGGHGSGSLIYSSYDPGKEKKHKVKSRGKGKKNKKW
jgi:hypothetical protein